MGKITSRLGVSAGGHAVAELDGSQIPNGLWRRMINVVRIIPFDVEGNSRSACMLHLGGLVY